MIREEDDMETSTIPNGGSLQEWQLEIQQVMKMVSNQCDNNEINYSHLTTFNLLKIFKLILFIAKQMKRWYQGIKSSIKYRIKSAESQGRLSAQLLQENYQEAIRMLYHHHPYEYWHQAEYLTKHCLLHAFDVE